MEKKKSFNMMSKLLIYFLSFSLILIGFLWLFQVVFLEDFYKEIKTRELKYNSKLLMENIESDDFENIARDISYRYGIDIKLVTESESIYFPAHGGVQSIMPGEGIINDFKGNLPYRESQIPPPNRKDKFLDVLEYGDSLLVNGQEIEIHLRSIISPVDATITTLKTQLIIITLIMIFVSIILSIIISKSLARPIISISSKVQELGKSNYQVNFDEYGYREVEDLSSTLNRTTKELEKVDLLRRELVSNISHDLKTPLTLIEGYAEAMRDLPGENNTDNAQIIIDEAKKLNELITDSIDISSIETGVKMPVFKLHNISELIKNNIELMEKSTLLNKISIKFIAEYDVFVLCDKSMIERAFNNLLHNGINYGAENDQIIVEQKVEDNQVLISVRDHGLGIEKDQLAYIWDRYYRTDRNHERSIAGTGLGLSIVKEIISKHGGDYGVNSSLGQGSSFWFSLKIENTD